MPKWTREQQNVINSRKSNLLVAAAAGSGKTAVLIERIINLVMDEKEPIDIDKLLVVTFTKAAASEMRERVGLAIEKALLKDPENTHLQKQLLLLNKAEICTIDSFCRNILKKNFHVIDADPNLNIADTTEIDLIANEVMDEYFEGLYEDGNEDFLRLVDWYSSRFNDDGLVNLLLGINRFINASPFPEKWLEESAAKFDISDKTEAFYIDTYLRPIAKEANLLLEPAILTLNEVVEDMSGYFDLTPYVEVQANFCIMLKDMVARLSTFIETGDLEVWSSISLLADSIMTSGKSNFRKSKKYDENAMILYDECKDIVKSLKEDAQKNCEKLIIDIPKIEKENKILYPYMRAISRVILGFREAFSQKKKSMNLVDFADVEHMALQILRDGDGPSQTALAMREQYVEVFTDEYQDSNEVQELILSMVSREDVPNRFMVGDVKQSIYRFRQAMPEIFMSKYMEYDEYDEENHSDNRKIMLYKNFRSREEVLEGCNHIFKNIMRMETGEMDYTDEERLNVGAQFEEGPEDSETGGDIEVYLADTLQDEESLAQQKMSEEELEELEEMSGFEAECNLIGQIIHDLVDNKERNFQVFDKHTQEYRPVEYKDIVILMRSPSSKAGDVEKVLAEYEIPVYSDAGGGYFASIEVSTMTDLLKVIDNPIQDIPLIAVMRSPIYNFTTDELARIRLVDREASYYDCLLKSREDEKIDNFLSDIERYRRASTLMSVDEFIWMLLKDTGYYTYVGLLFNGQQRQKNLLLLFERARKFEQSSYKGLFNFISYTERIKSRSQDLGEAKNLSEDANIVRVMSIHKSKGLEFPVVIVATSDKKFNLRSNDSSISLHQRMGYGPKIIDLENMNTFDSSTKKLIDTTVQNEQIAEEMRLLYVAMTRAKEKLIFTGRVKDYEKKADAWKKVIRDGDGRITALEILKAKSYLNWIMPTIINGATNWKIKVEPIQKIVSNKTEILAENEREEVRSKAEDIDIKEFREELESRFSKGYKYADTAKKPSSISVTDVKKALIQQEEEEVEEFEKNKDVEMKIPDFMHGKDIEKKFTYAERGTIFHLVMQVLDLNAYENTSTNEEIDEVSRRQIASMVEKNILSEEEAESVNTFWIRRFIQSWMFKQLLEAQKEGLVYREKAINYSIKMKDIYTELDTEEEMMLVGIVDIFFERDNKLVLLDYKTDYVDNDNKEEAIANIVKKYKIQLEMYKKALEDISDKEVEKTYLYLFSVGRLVEVK